MNKRIDVDPIGCTGHGLCAELFPERITLDDWGYPMIDPAGVPPELGEHALRAVRACPTVALRLLGATSSVAASANPLEPRPR
jgi:ferredoxin